MKLPMCSLALLTLAACGDDAMTAPAADAPSAHRTLATCATTIAADVPAPYDTLFRCVDVSVTGTDLLITSRGLPPHDSYYYGTGDPNFVAWDARGGAYHPNPNVLAEHARTFTIPLAPVSRNLTITAALVDGVNNTNANEYRGGPVGVALDSVFLFNALAAPGDNIATEQYTFDPYNAHPAPSGEYHYHRDSIGPTEVSPLAYGLLCDGTFVLGCTELDGSPLGLPALDAQNGHVHALAPLGDRYHVHLCPGTLARVYTPEIQFYDRCTIN
ncbi:MAG: YHYH protein [Proteobacteria bacterium]|nr:YHYH protein [Pseudomonadota bacterium]